VSVWGLTLKIAGLSPVPLSAANTDDTPLVVELTVKKPLLPPTIVGVNVTVTVQLPPAANVCVQPFDWIAKSPEIASVGVFNEAVPGFITTMLSGALVELTSVAGKLNVLGFKLNDAGAVPVPVDWTLAAVTPGVEDVAVVVPLNAPCCCGEK
jgi:hypothetical protein